jgi:nucleotide-binding universal stress UspA family protein
MASSKSKQWAGFRSVLCPVDFSAHSRQALRYAQAVAEKSHGAVTVAYANDPLLVAAAAAALHDRNVAKRSLKELQTFVDETLGVGKTGPRLQCRVSVGSPADEILKAAARGRSDLIVLGTHGLTGADRLLLGSTTLSVLQRANVPVLAVPRRGGPQDEGPSPSWPGNRIMAPIELNDAASREIETAARLARWFGSSLLTVHVVPGIAAPHWLRGDLSAHDRIRVAQAQRQIDALAAIGRRHVPTEGRVTCGAIADEITALAASERIELLIAALHDRRGWFGARRGSVSYHVLAYAVAPVLAYPQPWRPR